MERSYEKYFRQNRLPHLWCPGCGNGIAMKAIVMAIEKHPELTQDNTVIVSGIGCSSRASGYMDFDTLHTAHGRALPFATGIKMARPDLHVIVITGDGDCTAIGGNHFIHSCRRNHDLTVILFNNNIYGMTGGQTSPMTPQGKKATTTPYGALARPLDPSALAKAAGATYVARSTAYHVNHLASMIERGQSRIFLHRGHRPVSHCLRAQEQDGKPGRHDGVDAGSRSDEGGMGQVAGRSENR